MKLKTSLLLVICVTSALSEDLQIKRVHRLKDAISSVLPDGNYSIWESDPVELDDVKIQVLDKISGKVFHSRLAVKQMVKFGTIDIELRKAFKNSPDDNDEVYAYVEVKEKGKIVFNDWLFASSPSVNLFKHPVYDIRVEF